MKILSTSIISALLVPCTGFANAPVGPSNLAAQKDFTRDRIALQNFAAGPDVGPTQSRLAEVAGEEPVEGAAFEGFDQHHRSTLSLGDVQCAVTCARGWDSRECYECFDEAVQLGQLPVSYATDMLQFKLGTSYTQGWCGTRVLHPEEGVNVQMYPSGWRPLPDGSFTGCEKSTDFPGMNTTSHQSHAFVKEEMQKLPGRQLRGEVWRGNELGFIVSNEVFWPPQLKPRSVLLGASPQQHQVFRPILDRLFSTCDQACQDRLWASARVLQQKPQLRVQTDIKVWVHEELFKTIFPGETNPLDAEQFVSTQSSFTTLSTITQLLPDWATELDAVGGRTIRELRSYFDAYRPLVQKHYGMELAELSHDSDCGENDCVDQLTSAFLDTLLAAGGLSVPGAISTGLWVMYGQTQDAAYGGAFPEDFRLDNEHKDPRAFFYECMRFFAPVVGLPWWTVPPARAQDEQASQMEGGMRTVLNLAGANKDPNAWGPDAHKFRVRSLGEYHAKFVGFADFAVDASVAGGRMNRRCPGKTLALEMGVAFFKSWDQAGWFTNDESSYFEATPFVDEFTLQKPEKVDFWSQIWHDLLSQGTQLLATDGRFDQYTRIFSALNSYEVIGWTYPKAADVAPPRPHQFPELFTMGLAEEIQVPKDDEGWEEVGHAEAFVTSNLAKLLTFPDSADECGAWAEGGDDVEDPEAVLRELIFSGLNERRILVPWNDEKYTDAGLEDLVLRGIGQHRIQRVLPDDVHASTATYAVYLGITSSFETKPGFANLGADAYFDEHGRILHIVRNGVTYTPDGEQGAPAYTTQTSRAQCDGLGGQYQRSWWPWSDGTCSVPAKLGWKHAKMAFLGSLSAVITAIDHLYGLHLVIANSIITANVDELLPEHPLRQLMHVFGFRTAAINWKAAFALVNEFGLIHRSMPLTTTGLRQLYTFARTSAAGLTWKSIPERHAAQGVDADKISLPLHEDGADFYAVVKQFVHAYLSQHFDFDANACASDEPTQRWYAHVNQSAPSHDLPATLSCETLEDILATFIYYVTAGHTHVGSMVSEVEDPCHAPWGWREGELCGTPRTTYTQLVTFALTSLEQPKLYDDYSHVFDDLASKQLWREFQANLKEFGTRVDARNANRQRPFKSFDIRLMEVSVAI